MAESEIQVTAGTGEHVSTFTRADTRKAQIVCIGDPSVGEAPVDATAGLAVHIRPYATGQMLRHHFVAAGTTNAANVKAGPGQIKSIHISNHSADGLPVKLTLYNNAGAPTAGTSVVEAYTCSSGVPRDINFEGNPFTVGIARALTKVAAAADMADSSTTVCTANDAIVEIKYI